MEKRLVEDMLDRGVDGFLYAAMSTREVRVPSVFRGHPVVMVNYAVHGRRATSVLPDETGAGRTAAEALLAAGHRDHVYLVGETPPTSTRRGSAAAGIDAAFATAETRLAGQIDALWWPDSAYRAVREFLAHRLPGDGVHLPERPGRARRVPGPAGEPAGAYPRTSRSSPSTTPTWPAGCGRSCPASRCRTSNSAGARSNCCSTTDALRRALDAWCRCRCPNATRSARRPGERCTVGRVTDLLPPLPEDWERGLAVAAHPDDIEYGTAVRRRAVDGAGQDGSPTCSPPAARPASTACTPTRRRRCARRRSGPGPARSASTSSSSSTTATAWSSTGRRCAATSCGRSAGTGPR